MYLRGMPAGLDYDDERYVDPEFIDAHRARTLVSARSAGLNDHAAVMVATHGQWAAIDLALAEVVYLLWQRGLETGQSCEDEEGLAQLVFLDSESADEFRSYEPSPGWHWEELEDDDGEPSDEWAVAFPLSDVPAVVVALRTVLDHPSR
jgi:hypothetical protein